MMWQKPDFLDESRSIVCDRSFPFPHGCTTLRAGNTGDPFDTDGSAPVVRGRFYKSCGMDPGHMVRIAVEHRWVVKVITGDSGARAVSCDGLITTLKRLPLSLATGDCVPLMLADEAGTAVGLIHVSRHNVSNPDSAVPDEGLPMPGIVERALSLFKTLGVPPERLHALLGPSILECCYDYASPANLVTVRLQDAGLSRNNIRVMNTCTCCSKDTVYGGPLFPSHRRSDRAKKQRQVEPEGRMETAVMLA